ncbi:MAG: YncE family protein [Rhodospirillales bacterium]
MAGRPARSRWPARRSPARLRHRPAPPLRNCRTANTSPPPSRPARCFKPSIRICPGYRNFRAGWALRTALSPDGHTLLVLTSGYNLLNYSAGPQRGQGNPAASNEYVFVYDVAGENAASPAPRQVLQVPNSFYGLVWAPDGRNFYVSGGVSDAVFVFGANGGTWSQTATIAFNHPPLADNLTGTAKLLGAFLNNGLGFEARSAVSGLAITPDGATLVAANIYNDSISVIDTASNTVRWEYDLRPFNNTPALSGTPGGEMPYEVAIAPERPRRLQRPLSARCATAKSSRCRCATSPPDGGTLQRIALPGNPNSMVVSADGSRLYVAQDNSDTVAVIHTATYAVTGEIAALSVPGLPRYRASLYRRRTRTAWRSRPDGKTLYVSEGGANAVAAIDLTRTPPAAATLIPTGWYPHAVSVSADGKHLYVVNGKSDPGPDPKSVHGPFNQYIEQIVQGGLLSLPVPATGDYAALTAQVSTNNGYTTPESAHDRKIMAAVHAKIQHVIYIIKENRTFDQVLGDLGNGSNGDPKLTMFGRGITPSFHAAARQFVTLDNTDCAGEVSANGWPWSTGAREADFGVTTVPLNYAGRGFSDDSAGMNRIVNVTPRPPRPAGRLPHRQRHRQSLQVLGDAMPGGYTNLLPGLFDDFATDGPRGTPLQTGNIWDSALRAGLTVRKLRLQERHRALQHSDSDRRRPAAGKSLRLRHANRLDRQPHARAVHRPVFPRLRQRLPRHLALGRMEPRIPALRRQRQPAEPLLRAPDARPHRQFLSETVHIAVLPGRRAEHTGMQQADNDYSVGKLIESVARSPYAANTQIYIIEDDAQPAKTMSTPTAPPPTSSAPTSSTTR